MKSKETSSPTSRFALEKPRLKEFRHSDNWILETESDVEKPGAKHSSSALIRTETEQFLYLPPDAALTGV